MTTTASTKQIDFIKRLVGEGQTLTADLNPDEADAATLPLIDVKDDIVNVLAGFDISGHAARRVIDTLLAVNRSLRTIAAAKVEATPADEVESWLASLGRKVTPEDVTPAIAAAATAYAKAYTGSFGYMVSMKANAYLAPLSEAQAKGTLNCWRADVNKRAAASRPDPEIGVYVDPASGDIVRIYRGTQSGRLNGKRNSGNGWQWTGRNDFAVATPENKITAEQAAAFGHLNNECVFCGRHLDDPRSENVGYGPTCAKNYGLPWGEKKSEKVVLDSPVGPGALTPTGFAGRPDFRPSAVVVL